VNATRVGVTYTRKLSLHKRAYPAKSGHIRVR